MKLDSRCRRILGLEFLALVLLLAGCNVLPQPQADTVRYFTLGGPPATSAAPGGVTVRPVLIAGHLRNRSMAVRIGENEVIYLEDVRWAEPLADGLTQSLRSRLASVAADAVVSVRVQRLEVVRPDGNAVELAATFTVDALGAPVRHGSFTATPRTWDGKDYAALVSLMREATVELGDSIAMALTDKK